MSRFRDVEHDAWHHHRRYSCAALEHDHVTVPSRDETSVLQIFRVVSELPLAVCAGEQQNHYLVSGTLGAPAYASLSASWLSETRSFVPFNVM